MQMQRQSLNYSEASYCDGDTYDDWGSSSSLTKSYPDEASTQRTDSYAEELTSVRAERDSLVRALSAERQRAASVAAAQDARLAELHGVIAELMRRRTLDKHSNTILEEETDRSEDCDSTSQPVGELENDENVTRTDQHDNDVTRTDQHDNDVTRTDQHDNDVTRTDQHDNDVTRTDQHDEETLQHSAVDLPTPDDANLRCSGSSPWLSAVGSSCERVRGSGGPSPGGSEFRQAKLASRVKLRRTEDVTCHDDLTHEFQLVAAAERLSLEADVREAHTAGDSRRGELRALLALSACVCARLRADLRVSHAVTQRAQDQACRLVSVSAVSEGALRGALVCADRALECYDSILALWETREHPPDNLERKTAETVATQLLHRLESNEEPSDTLSPGPWLDTSISSERLPYNSTVETSLRLHAARLKAETVALRAYTTDTDYNYHDSDSDPNVEEMEAAIAMQEVCLAEEKKAEWGVRLLRGGSQLAPSSDSSRRENKKHWIETQDTSETDL